MLHSEYSRKIPYHFWGIITIQRSNQERVLPFKAKPTQISIIDTTTHGKMREP